MEITYNETKTFTTQQLQQLFASVAWESGKYPELLVQSMQSMGSVFCAWHQDTLIGLASTMDDGVMNAYTHYLLVNPKYQGQHIGQELMNRVKEYYKDYKTLVLIASAGKAGFYQNVGYTPQEEVTSMFLKK